MINWVDVKVQLPPRDQTVILYWTEDEEGDFPFGYGIPEEYDNTLMAIGGGYVTHWALILSPKQIGPYTHALISEGDLAILKYKKNRACQAIEECAKMVDHILCEGGGTYGDRMRQLAEE